MIGNVPELLVLANAKTKGSMTPFKNCIGLSLATTFINPEIASFDESVFMLCMVLIGGTGNYRGPLTGVAIVLLVPEALRLLDIPPIIAGKIRLMLYGGILILLMHVRPQGVAGEYRIE